jgi:hypothetical protein
VVFDQFVGDAAIARDVAERPSRGRLRRWSDLGDARGAIEHVLDGATVGHGAVVITEGEAGIGTLYLLDVGAGATRDRSGRTLP